MVAGGTRQHSNGQVAQSRVIILVGENVAEGSEHFKHPPTQRLCSVSRTDEGSRSLKLPPPTVKHEGHEEKEPQARLLANAHRH